jgi:hypothetical protein
MSFAIDRVVDIEATAEEAPGLAERVVNNLLSRGIILPTPQTHKIFTDGARYANGPHVAQVADFNDCFPCGLDVEFGRGIYDAGENGLDAVICPKCRHQYHPDDSELDWGSAIHEWYDGKDGLLICRQCGNAESVRYWPTSPMWGLGELAFIFREWLLREEFVAELSSLLGHRVAWVQAHY